MRCLLRWLPDSLLNLMIPLVWGSAGLGLVAVILGRSAPEPGARPSPRAPAIGVTSASAGTGPRIARSRPCSSTPRPAPSSPSWSRAVGGWTS